LHHAKGLFCIVNPVTRRSSTFSRQIVWSAREKVELLA
jgi:hypothetical protein